jgi:membrane protease YdiL (CAAX protease family)
MTELGSGRMSVPWNIRDVLLAAGLVLGSFAAILLAARVIVGSGLVEESTLRSPWFASSFHGGLLLAVWVFAVRRYRERWAALGLRRARGAAAFGLPWLALLLSILFTALYGATVESLGIELLTPRPMESGILGHGFARGINALSIVAWVPFVEEVFFRGFLMAALVEPLGALRAAVVSSLIFAAGHLMLSAMIPFFFTGLLLSWLYIRTGSVWPPMAAHAAQNLLALSIAS